MWTQVAVAAFVHFCQEKRLAIVETHGFLATLTAEVWLWNKDMCIQSLCGFAMENGVAGTREKIDRKLVIEW